LRERKPSNTNSFWWDRNGRSAWSEAYAPTRNTDRLALAQLPQHPVLARVVRPFAEQEPRTLGDRLAEAVGARLEGAEAREGEDAREACGGKVEQGGVATAVRRVEAGGRRRAHRGQRGLRRRRGHRPMGRQPGEQKPADEATGSSSSRMPRAPSPALRRAAESASLYLKMPVDEWGLLEFEKLDAIAERGYSAAAEPLRAWWTTQQSSVDAH